MRPRLITFALASHLLIPVHSDAQTQDWLLMRATFAAEAYAGDPEPRSTIASAAIAGGIGALIDYGIDDQRVVYRASKPTVTLLRMSF